jgi:hypothetical protein
MNTHPALQYNLSSFDDTVKSQVKSHKNWLWHLLPILAKQQPATVEGQIDISATIERLANSTYEHEGFNIPGTKILFLWQFLCNTSRSDLLPFAQNKDTSLSAGVPIILYAYKHQHSIPYNAWREVDGVSEVLGKDLAWLPEYKDFEHHLSVGEINSIRRLCLTELKIGGKTAEDHSNKLNRIKGRYQSETTSEMWDGLPRLLRYMILQTWIFHPSLRSPNMITDWTDWDDPAPIWNTSHVVSQAEAISRTKSSIFSGARW